MKIGETRFFMDGIWQVFLLAMTPIGESNGSIPVALAVYKMPWFWAYFISVLGNLMPAIFVLLVIGPVMEMIGRKWEKPGKYIHWVFERTREKGREVIRKHGQTGLIVLIALPFPFAGVWTASLIAFLFGFSFKKAFPLMIGGVLVADILILLAAKSGIAINKYFGWETLLIIIAIILILWLFRKFHKLNVKS